MPVPTTLSDLSTTIGSNYPTGGETVGTNMDDYLRAHAGLIAQVNANKLETTTAASTYQPLDPLLTSLAGQTTAANKIQAYSGADTASLIDFKDEDDMASNSATAVPSQQSVKAYVDTSVSSLSPYSCQAWVVFNGTGTAGTNMTIASSGNVSSVYKNSTGDYTINFTNAMPSTSYAIQATAARGATDFLTSAMEAASGGTPVGKSASACRVIVSAVTSGPNFTPQDSQSVNVCVFR